MDGWGWSQGIFWSENENPKPNFPPGNEKWWVFPALELKGVEYREAAGAPGLISDGRSGRPASAFVPYLVAFAGSLKVAPLSA